MVLELGALLAGLAGIGLAVVGGRRAERLEREVEELRQRLQALEAAPAPVAVPFPDPGPALEALRAEMAALQARAPAALPAAPPPEPPAPRPTAVSAPVSLTPLERAAEELDARLMAAQREKIRFARQRLTPEVVPEIYDLLTQGGPPLRPEVRESLVALVGAAGLRLLEPRRGDVYESGLHTILRTEQCPSDDLQDCVGERLSAGFVGPQGVVRKAEVTVYR